MHALASVRVSRILTFIIPSLLLVGCFGEGDGQDRILNAPVPPPPPVPEGFCDGVNFEPQCPAVSFTDFEGGVITVEATEDLPTEVVAGNDSINVGRMIKAAAESGATFGGSTIALASPFQVTPGSSFTMRVYSPRPVNVLFQPEPQGPGSGVEVRHGGDGWEEMTFPLPAVSGTVTGVTLIFDNGILGDFDNDPDNWTFYFDDIALVAGDSGAAPDLPVDFEDADATYLFSDFGGGAATVIDNPDQSGLNTSARTAQMQKLAGEVFGGSTLSLANDIDFSQGGAFTMKVWASRAVPVLFKLEDAVSGDPALGKERSVDHSGSGTWEELCFDFTGDTAGFTSSSITFIFDLGTAGDAENDPDNWTFYFDEIEQAASCDAGGGSAPVVAAPTPTQDPANVISLFSDAYTDVAVDTFRAGFSAGDLADITIEGNATKEYTNLDFVGIEFVSAPLDVSGMTHFRMDIWTPNADSVLVKLVDFGSDGFGGGNDSEGPVTFNADSTPALTQGEWISLDIPLADMQTAGLANLTDINQLIISATPPGTVTLYVDNIYFYNADAGGSGGDAPTVAAPVPAQAEADVISLFSDAYTNVTIDTWRTDWSSATLTEVTIDGNMIKQYTDLDFVGVEAVSSPIDATGATHFHVDVWTPNAEQLRIKLVDFGADAAFGGGDDTEAELVFDAMSTPALTQGEWISLDIPLADFQTAGLANTGTIAQLIFSASPPGTTTLYVTNVYFYDAGGGGGGSSPTAAAPTPTQDAADVISLFSDAYTDVAVDTWRTDWSAATLADIDIAGNATKEYTDLDFVGIETVASQVDASAMTHFRVDLWTPNADLVRIKLVDFGADGAFGGGDDTEGELTLDAASTPALAQGSWVSLDIQLADFEAAGLANRSNLAQLIISATPAGTATLYVDNVYYYDAGSGGEGGAAAIGPVDFESGGLGAAFTWIVFENDDNPAVNVIANPDASGANTSATVAEFTARAAGQPFAGTVTEDLGTFTLDASNSCVKIKVWKAVVSDVGIKFETADFASTGEIRVPNTATSQWEELVFDFSAKIGEPTSTDITRFVLFPDFDARTQENVVYFDDIAFFDGGQCP